MKNFLKTILILTSIFFPLLVSFLLSVMMDVSLNTPLGIPGMIVVLLARMIILSGIYVTILEIIRGEEVQFLFKRAFENAREFSGVFILMCACAALGHLIMYALIPGAHAVTLQIFFAHVYLLIQYLFIRFVINRRYLTEQKGLPVKLQWSWEKLAVLFALQTIDLGLSYLGQYDYLPSGPIVNLAGFIRETVELTQFIYLAVNIFDCSPELKNQLNSVKEIYLVDSL